MGEETTRRRMRFKLPESDNTPGGRGRQLDPEAATERTPLLRKASGMSEASSSRGGVSRGDRRENNCNNNNNNSQPLYSCVSNPSNHLPVYTNIHRIRRDITSVVEDYLSLDQLRDVRINVTVVRPLVDKLYDLDDISIVYCLFVNRAQFIYEQSHLSNRQNVHFSRATLCELIATRILRRFSEDSTGNEGLLLLSHILVAGFEPFQNAPKAVQEQAKGATSWIYHKTLPALEVAILTESKYFLSSTPCQKVIDAIYEGRVIYTPSSFIDLIPDHYKQKPISIYDPREAPLLNQYRLIVPRTRNYLEVFQYVLLLGFYLLFMLERDASRFSLLEALFAVYTFGWVLDQFATILEHGWHVYTQNLWSFLDVCFSFLYFAYAVLRIHGVRTNQLEYGQQALDIMAIAAPVLVPRLAFNVLSNNLVFLSLRAMMADFTILTALAAWCFGGFLLSLWWLSMGKLEPVTIGKWMLWIWFGLDGTGIQRSAEFHELWGPALMVAYAFLGNTLFLTILVSMLSNTFANIASNTTAEVQFRRAVLTLEGVKSDAIFAYQPPFNIVAFFLFIPLRFIVSPRWFHKIHVATVRLVNMPLLLLIAVFERRLLWPSVTDGTAVTESGHLVPYLRRRKTHQHRGQPLGGFWDKWRITAHRDIRTVFEIEPPDAVGDEISKDDTLTHNLIRRQFTRHASSTGSGLHSASSPAAGPPATTTTTTTTKKKMTSTANSSNKKIHGGKEDVNSKKGDNDHSSDGEEEEEEEEEESRPPPKKPARRDSMFPGVTQKLRGSFSEGDDAADVAARLQALELATGRIERMLMRLAGDSEGEEDEGGSRNDEVVAAKGKQVEGEEVTNDDGLDPQGNDSDVDPMDTGGVSRSGTAGSSTLRGSVDDIERQ